MPRPESETMPDAGIPGASTVPRIGVSAPGATPNRVLEPPTVDTPSGALTFAIPLPQMPARGAAPDLSLRYHSGAGNDVFGIGWSVPVSFVGVHLRDGLPRHDASDRFALDGDEMLVAVRETADPAAPQWQEDVTLGGVAYRVHRFAPRVNEGLEHVDRLTRLSDGEVHWRVLSGDGAVRIYGLSPAARIADPADPTRVFRWLLERAHDVNGNVTAYDYADHAGPGAQHVSRPLKTVRFGALTPYDPATEALPGFAYHLVFDYGDHDPAAPAVLPDRPREPRDDPFSDRRAGFELRTDQLCRRVLLFHDLPELGPQPVLTQALELTYGLADGTSRLDAFTMAGFAPAPGGGYLRQAMPVQRFGYADFAHDAVLAPLTLPDGAAALPGLAAAPAGGARLWADLRGNGLPGVLSDDGGTLRFASNMGDGRLADPVPLAQAPAGGDLGGGTVTLEQVDRDGRVALTLRTPSVQGFFALDDEGNAGPFRPFDSAAQPRSGQVFALDATGDGYGDVLDLGEVTPLLSRGLGQGGHGPFRDTGSPVRPEPRPADAGHAVLMADVTGDGLLDVVDISATTFTYWPGLGHGRFGAARRITGMPDLAAAGPFDPRRLRLASLRGAGPADLIYAGADALIYAINVNGVRFDAARRIAAAGLADSGPGMQVVDLMGQGVATLLLPDAGGGAARHVCPAGPVRPHLLTRVENGMGAETAVTYTASAVLCQKARAAGRPWRGSVPYSVPCVTQIDRTDHLRGLTTTQRMGYAHAVFDAAEREFRGFARVDLWDVSEADEAVIADRQDDPFHQPMIHTRRWFDTALPPPHPMSAESLRAEWWDGGGADLAWRPEAPRLPGEADPAHLRRARRGALLREEIYEVDGRPEAAVPVVTRCQVQDAIVLQTASDGWPAIVRAVPRDEVAVTWERSTADPGATQTLTLARDPLGIVTLAASVAYGRQTGDMTLPPAVRAEQARNLIEVAETWLTADSETPAPARRFLRRRGWRSRAWTLEGISRPAGRVFQAAELLASFQAAPVIGYERPSGTVLSRRLTGDTRDRFLAADLATALPDGVLGDLPISARRYQLALTPGLRASVWPADFADDATLIEAGYRDLDGDGQWWAPSGQAIRDAGARARFLLPSRIVDAMGVTLDLTYDRHALFVVAERDGLGNASTVEVDYRVGQNRRHVDPNGTITELAFDTLGRVTAQAIRGADGSGDTLADPTLTMDHDPDAYTRDGTPPSERSRMRETHASAATRWFERVQYFDGMGQVLQTREMADPGPADRISGAAVAQTDTGAAPRWRVSPCIRLTNKGAAAGAFHPWFSDTDAFDDDPRLTERGLGPVDTLNGRGETDRTDFPGGTFATSDRTPWRVTKADRNDTVRDSDWYVARGQPDPAGPEPAGADAHAAWVAARHHGTTGESQLDPTGAIIYETERQETGPPLTTRVVRSTGGHSIETLDAAGRRSLAEWTDLTGRTLSRETMEDGRAHLLPDVAGQAFLVRRPGGDGYRMLWDALRRPLGVAVTPAGGGAPVIGALTIYGDGHPEAAARNLRTRVLAILDGSGLTVMDRYDFKGGLLGAEKQFLADPLTSPDWTALIGQAPEAAIANARGLMDPERHVSETAYDALGRAVRSVSPDGTVSEQTFGIDAGLARLRLTPGAGGAARDVVTAEEHDAWGALTRTRLGDGSTVTFERDPGLRHVTRQTVTRDRDGRRLLDAAYARDPVGNICSIADGAAAQVFFANAVTDGTQRFEYDAQYRLTRATGRELAALSATPWHQEAGVGLPHANNAGALRRYARSFSYDLHGNLTEIHHAAGPTQWRRRMRYAAASNRIEAVSAPGDAAGVFSLAITSDAAGRMTGGAGLGPMTWSPTGQLTRIDLGGGGVAHYIAGAGGARVRKIIERSGGLRDDWLYLGDLEIFRRSRNGVVIEERRTLKVMSGGKLLLRIETKTADAADPTDLNVPLWRYRHEDQTGSIVVETSGQGDVLVHETYHPFGTTAYRSSANAAEAALHRYRYASRETDAESGLVCMGQRYYARWLGRWISPDPAGPVEGPNLYAYCANNPVMHSDGSGTQSTDDKGDTGTTTRHHSTWSWEELKNAVKAVGGTMGAEVNENNYKDYYKNGKWAVLVVSDADATEDSDAATPGAGGSKTGEEATAPPPAADAGPGSGGGKAGDGTAAEGDAGPGGDTAATPKAGAEGQGQGDGKGTAPDAADGSLPNPFNPGASAVAGYNSYQRSAYSKGNIKNAIEAVKKVEAAIATNNRAAAWAAAKEASDKRNAARARTQARIKWTGGKGLSKLLEVERGFRDNVKHYFGGQNKPLSPEKLKAWNKFTPGLPQHNPGPRSGHWHQITRDIAIGSGKTNQMVSRLSNFGKRAGPIGTALGVGIGVYNYHQAPPDQKTRVAIGETASFVGGAVGFAAGSAGAAFLIGLAVSNPVGWAAIGVTVTVFAVGALAAWAGSALFRWAAESTYDAATQ